MSADPRAFTAEQRFAAAEIARADFYFFTRWMFLQRRGYTWRRASHHRLIANALTRVFSGECKRLIINVPPRYGKTEMAVVTWIAWCMGQAPDAEFIHASYSGTLAVNNSDSVRAVVAHEAYREIFPAVELAAESNAKAHWKTTAGGVLYAVGAGGTITGFGAGKHREGFGGCFPAGTLVWTESGRVPIDSIVCERMAVRVWAFDYAGRMVLRPVTGWHHNPPNNLVRVTMDDGQTVTCTPDHRFWTLDRGWVRADSLRVDDRLPCIDCGVQGVDDIRVDAQRGGRGLDPQAVFPAGASGPVAKGDGSLGGGEFGSVVGADTATSADVFAPSSRCVGVTSPNLVDDSRVDAVFSGEVLGALPFGLVDGDGLRVGQQRHGVPPGLAERAVRLAVRDVGGPGVVPQVLQPVVGRVAVAVAHVGTMGTRADEGQQHQGMDHGVLDPRAARQADAQMPRRHHGQLQDAAGQRAPMAAATVHDRAGLAPDVAAVADGVGAFISGHRKPARVEFIGHAGSTFCLTVDEHHNFTVEGGFVVKNCLVLDDPHKADEARSDVVRKGVIDWFQNTLESRKNSPDTPIILIMQRLHEDDLSGWLLGDRGKDMAGPAVPGGNGEVWEHLCLSAWADEAAGLPLWPEKHSADDLRRMELAAPYVFAGQYRQRPAPPTGGIFKPDNLRVVDAIPAGPILWVRGWDLGSTEGGGDPTAGGKLGRLPDGRYIIAGMVHGQYGPDDRDRILRTTAEADGQATRISIPQDPGQAGKSQVAAFAKLLAGYRLTTSPETGDKVTRAEPFASQVNVGNVLMLRGAWNEALIEELRLFPNGRHDDRVDALSRAFAETLSAGDGRVGAAEPRDSIAPALDSFASFSPF